MIDEKRIAETHGHIFQFASQPVWAPRLTFTFHGTPLAHQSTRIATVSQHRIGGPPSKPRLRAYKPKKVLDYQRAIAVLGDKTRMSWEVATKQKWPRDATYFVSVRVYLQDERRRDADNLKKPLYDALNRVLWKDDSQIQLASFGKFLDKEHPRVQVMVEVIG